MAYTDHLPFDRYDDRDDEPRVVECKRCGESGLRWEREPDGRWQLYNARFGKHVCDPRRTQRGVADDFDDLDA